MSKLTFSRENTASKMKGAGDGVKDLARSVERTPVPSSRKFTATLVKNESVQLKLKKALDELEAKQSRFKKAKTVAEITPTKSYRKKPKRQAVGASHATPRSPVDAVKKPPSGRDAADDVDERQRRLELLVYRRMLLFVWRRSKARLAMLSESLRRRQDQIHNLEKQVNCLKDLTQSECHKRGETMGEYQRMENILQKIRTENNSLIAEKTLLQNEVNDLREKFQNLSIDIQNMKNEIYTKNIYTKQLEKEIREEKNFAIKIKGENEILMEKVKAQDFEIKSQEDVTDKLNQALRELENRLKECKEDKKACLEELNNLAEQYRLKVKSCDCMRHELGRVCSVKEEMKRKIEDLEHQLSKACWESEVVFKENELLRKEVREKYWWKNAKEFAIVSWAVLQNAAYLMLPAL